jgi:hypothetical protein
VAGAEEERELHERRAFLDWKDIPRWSHLRDVDRVYLDPYINDRYAHNTTTFSPRLTFRSTPQPSLDAEGGRFRRGRWPHEARGRAAWGPQVRSALLVMRDQGVQFHLFPQAGMMST